MHRVLVHAAIHLTNTEPKAPFGVSFAL